MARLNGGQALIQALDANGIRLALGIPGAGQYEAVDALYNHPRIRYLSVRHEQATSYMADGYARVSGQLAALIVVQGPGFFNAAAGIATAYACSTPMLVITGADHLDRRRKGQGGREPSAAIRSVTKWAGRAATVEEVPALVAEAVRQARSGRPRPVGIEVPAPVLAAVAEVEPYPPVTLTPAAATAEQIEQAAARLRQAQRPLIWAGGGVQSSGAWEELRTLAERWQAPVVTTRSGKGVISDRHPLALGFGELRYAPLRRYIEGRDLILAVGASADLSRLGPPVVRIDVDPDASSAGATLTLVADARQALAGLLAALRDLAPARTDVEAEVAALRADRFDPARQLQPQWDLMAAVRAALPDEAVVVQGMNQMGYYSRNYFPVYAPRSYLTSSSLATLGAGYPLALGAKLGAPARPVVALCGDGGFLYNSQELATAVQQGIPAIVIVFNDNAYGNVLRAQQDQFDGRVLGAQLHNPDFVQLARAYGACGLRAEGAAELEDALRRAVVEEQPTLIEVPVGPMQREY